MQELFDFRPQRDKLYKQVADRLQQLIIAESLRPGDRLPSERELAGRMGVSRTVIREAIRALGVRGLVRVKPGCGTYVREPSIEDAAANIGLFLKLWQAPQPYKKIYEIRHTLEVEAAGLAATRSSDRDLEALESAIQGMMQSLGDTRRYIEYDMAFHQAIAQAAHNELFSVLLDPISDLLREFMVRATQVPGAMKDGIEYHKVLLEQIKAKDRAGARDIMREHLSHAHELVEAVQSQLSARAKENDRELS